MATRPEHTNLQVSKALNTLFFSLPYFSFCTSAFSTCPVVDCGRHCDNFQRWYITSRVIYKQKKRTIVIRFEVVSVCINVDLVIIVTAANVQSTVQDGFLTIP